MHDRNLSDVTYAIVVHHNNTKEIIKTLDSLISDGVNPERIILVDNSENLEIENFLLAFLPESIHFLSIENKGFGNAANVGLNYINYIDKGDCNYVAILTHESQIKVGTIAELQKNLNNHRNIFAAGPLILKELKDDVVIFSAGGKLSPVSLKPKHIRHNREIESNSVHSVVEEVDWLDQTFVLYKYSVIRNWRFDEGFRMYSEEVELHARMKRNGWVLINVRSIAVMGFTNGVPASTHIRQQRILRDRLASSNISRMLSLASILRSIIYVIRREGLKKSYGTIRTNMREEIPVKKNEYSPKRIIIINPLKNALNHYVISLSAMLDSIGVDSCVIEIDEPSQSKLGKVRWVLNYLSTYCRARRSRVANSYFLIVWPFFGHFERVISSIFLGAGTRIIMHDPHPLVKSWGYSSFAVRVGRTIGRKSLLVTHSKDATDELNQQGLSQIAQMPHPLIPRNPVTNVDYLGKSGKIRVLGQYKPDRDLALMERIAQNWNGTHQFEVIGKGWEELNGWTVENRFLSEEELDILIETSDIILIPYKNFYQSGIAVRAIELGIPFLAPRKNFFEEMLEDSSRFLIDNADDVDEWKLKMDNLLKQKNKNVIDKQIIYKNALKKLENFVSTLGK